MTTENRTRVVETRTRCGGRRGVVKMTLTCSRRRRPPQCPHYPRHQSEHRTILQVTNHKLVLFTPQTPPPGQRPPSAVQTHRPMYNILARLRTRTRNNIVYRVIILKLDINFFFEILGKNSLFKIRN